MSIWIKVSRTPPARESGIIFKTNPIPKMAADVIAIRFMSAIILTSENISSFFQSASSTIKRKERYEITCAQPSATSMLKGLCRGSANMSAMICCLNTKGWKRNTRSRTKMIAAGRMWSLVLYDRGSSGSRRE
jgi:hypothetical protein